MNTEKTQSEPVNPALSKGAVMASALQSNIIMKNKCQCKLPYVHNGTDTCTQCQNKQTRFLPITTEKPITLKREFNGNEFKKGDVVEVVGKSYACLVEIQHYIPNGWYHVMLPNGGYHDTQILGDVVS